MSVERKYWEPEQLPTQLDRVMAEKTFGYLSKEQQRIQAELLQIAGEAEGGHQRAQIHDSATLVSHANVLRGRLSMIGDLTIAQFIRPRQEVDRLLLGNRAVIWTDVDGEEEITLLGPDDAGTRVSDLAVGTRIISFRSPIGQVIFGLKNQDWSVAKVGENLVGINIRNVGPGVF